MRGLRKLTSLFTKVPKNFARNSNSNATAAEKSTLVKGKSPSKKPQTLGGSKEIVNTHSIASVLICDGARNTDSLGFDSQDQDLQIPWGGIGEPTNLHYMQSRKVIARERKQKVVYKNTINRRFADIVNLCGDKLGADDTLNIFGKLGRDTGLKEYNACIEVCINSAKKSFDEEESLQRIYDAYQILRAMKEHGVQIKETTYGPLLRYFVETGMVEEFEFFSKFITEVNPGAFSRVGYYEMLLWTKVGNEDKVQELCNSIGVDNVGCELTENYLLALCERDRDEELVKLLSVIDVTKVSSQDYLSNIFESLGKRELKNFAEKFILALKASEATEEKLSHFIYSYAISIPVLVVEDAISEFEKLHEKFHVPPSSFSYEELFRYCCKFREVHAALDIVDKMDELGFPISLEKFHQLLDAVEESRELDLVRPVYSRICRHNSDPSSETFRRMINLLVRMKDFEGAYNMLSNMEEMGLRPTTVMYNAIMAGYFREKNIRGGLMVLNQMKNADAKPDSLTYSYLIANCESEEDLVKYREEMQSSGIQQTKPVYMATINAHVKFGQFEKAKKVVADLVPSQCINEVKSVLVSALASHGQFSDALQLYKEIKQTGLRVEPKATLSLFDHFQSDGELDRLMELLGELSDSDYWFDGCGRIILYCVRHNLLSSAVDLLKKLKDIDELSSYAVVNQAFAYLSEAEPTAVEVGLDFLRAVKEEVGLHPSRTSLDFLLSACASAKDAKRAWLIWEEYQKAGLLYNVLSYLRMYQVLLICGEFEAANIMLKNIATDDPHVRCIIQRSAAIFGASKCRSSKKNKKKKKKSIASVM
ncbi:pentatricopeptide repeat-containing protein At4g04790, mitochondrial-like isoform X1 [Papaver somniferum]|uniref:pentatricopeptide repeat-containing protein At4g04790, mitochondrial-like isoform X1 n=2 Tax=Papaver somniferum TaxID=3469 RepID=UPI000E700D17|nr:pentatricopeptide repeat-containing protein At4g04790, mitochondrial-like isoform X1 [Papaver somniferum]